MLRERNTKYVSRWQESPIVLCHPRLKSQINNLCMPFQIFHSTNRCEKHLCTIFNFSWKKLHLQTWPCMSIQCKSSIEVKENCHHFSVYYIFNMYIFDIVYILPRILQRSKRGCSHNFTTLRHDGLWEVIHTSPFSTMCKYLCVWNPKPFHVSIKCWPWIFHSSSLDLTFMWSVAFPNYPNSVKIFRWFSFNLLAKLLMKAKIL